MSSDPEWATPWVSQVSPVPLRELAGLGLSGALQGTGPRQGDLNEAD